MNEKIGKKKIIVLADLNYSLFFLFCFTFLGFEAGMILSLSNQPNFFYLIILLISWVFLIFIFIVLSKLFRKKTILANIGVCNWIEIKSESRDMLDDIFDIKIIK